MTRSAKEKCFLSSWVMQPKIGSLTAEKRVSPSEEREIPEMLPSMVKTWDSLNPLARSKM